MFLIGGHQRNSIKPGSVSFSQPIPNICMFLIINKNFINNAYGPEAGINIILLIIWFIELEISGKTKNFTTKTDVFIKDDWRAKWVFVGLSQKLSGFIEFKDRK